jgi:GH35 family endo-1,4-beta-xylanase
MLKHFYLNYYTIRRVDLHHCYLEFQEALKEKGIPVDASRLQNFKDNWKFILEDSATY